MNGIAITLVLAIGIGLVLFYDDFIRPRKRSRLLDTESSFAETVQTVFIEEIWIQDENNKWFTIKPTRWRPDYEGSDITEWVFDSAAYHYEFNSQAPGRDMIGRANAVVVQHENGTHEIVKSRNTPLTEQQIFWKKLGGSLGTNIQLSQ